jgi:proteasome accessory factor C
MTSPTGDRLSRLLAIVPYLLARPGVRLDEAAADLGVDTDQLRKDLNLLWVCGLPGYGPGDLIDLAFDGDTVTVTHDAGINRPLRLSADEALALVVALRALAEAPGVTDRDAVDRALAKIETAAGAAAEATARVAVRLEAPAQLRDVVNDALTRRRALAIRYYVPSRDEFTDRTVDAMRLLFVDNRWYLEAWCRSAQGVRLFRLDRVEEARVLEEPAREHGEAGRADPTELFRPDPEHGLVELRLAPEAHWVADYYPCESTVEEADGVLRVRLRVTDDAWVRRLALGYAGAVEVLHPPALAAAVVGAAGAALAAYAAG